MTDHQTTELDVIGLNCPLPVLKVRQALRGLKTGDRLVITATDPLSRIDIPHLCQEDGHRLVSEEVAADTFKFVILKGKTDQAAS